MVKNYVLDTNILIQNPNSIFGFEDNNIWITGTTLQELDGKKTAPGETGYCARECCRILDGIRMQGDLTEGVPINTQGKKKGTLYIEPDGVNQSMLPEGFSINSPDNRIISTCLYLNKTLNKKSPVILVTNDISMRVNASICGIRVEGYRNDHVQNSTYTGCSEINLTKKQIEGLFKDKAIPFAREKELPEEEIYDNHFFTAKNGTSSALCIYRHGELKLLPEKYSIFGGVKPMNAMQRFMLYALIAPAEEIPLVIISGPAGTAKTYLSLAAGLSQTYLGQGSMDGLYRKILIAKPNVHTDADFGYLPGDLESKMGPLVASYTDSLEALFSGADGNKEEPTEVSRAVEDLFDTGVIELCPLNYIRGRSIANSYIICDEAQNATKGLLRDVITRAGRGSKVILLGDQSQCDAPTLDEHNNGLIFCAEHLKSTDLSVVLRLSEKQCVRSSLAETAIRLMKD